MVRLLHTADWHLGQTLMGWSRDGEHAAALAAVVDVAEARAVDAVIVAGDVFDTQSPTRTAEGLLFSTLGALRRRLPRVTIVVTAGNHDPAGRLEAPHPLLAELGVHVVGSVAHRGGAIDLDRHLVTVTAADGDTVHVLALPYLGPAALPPIDRRGEAAGSPVARAVQSFHETAVAAARARIGAAPLVVTGHLAVAGGLESEGAERRILIGGEHAVPTDVFGRDLAYVALGHLHRAQSIGGERIRYAGSLFPLSATERDYDHGVTLVEIAAGTTRVEHVPLPRPAPFLRLPPRGAAAPDEIEALVAAMVAERGLDADTPLDRRPFVQFSVRLDGPAPNLKADLDRIAAARPIRFVGHLVDRPTAAATDPDASEPVDLADRDPADLFRLAFAAEWGVEPSPAHLDVFALLVEDVRTTGG